ncbi:MAG: rod shape-determining protein MreC [Anaerolineaceae bacterium]|jgi:rod shape-determining protein MreC
MNSLFSLKNARNFIIVLIVVGLLLLAVSGYLTPIFSFSLSPLIQTQSWFSRRYLAFRDFFTSPLNMAELRQRNLQLEAEKTQLESKIIELEQNIEQTDTLYSLLDFVRANPEHKYKAATVIGREISPFKQYLIIDKGSNDGILHGMPVVTSQGLVGRVDAVIATAARIQLISDAGSVVNVKLQNAKVEAQTNGSITGEISLVQVPQGVEVLPGEVLITSGLGGTYPANLFVGQVVTMQSQHNTLFQTGSVQPVVDFGSISAVLVITNFTVVNLEPLIP